MSDRKLAKRPVTTLRDPAELAAHGLVRARRSCRSRTGRFRATRCGDARYRRADRPSTTLQRSDRATIHSNGPPELSSQPGEHADPIGDHAHSPVAGIVHRYPDRVLLKLVHVCAVYCRFCFRREMVGPGKESTLPDAALPSRARLHQGASRDLGGDPDRRRSLDAVGAAGSPTSWPILRRSTTSRLSGFTPVLPVADPGGSVPRWSPR